MAVFYRTNALSRVLEDVLRCEGIPMIARGTAYYQREEVKHVPPNPLRVVANLADEVSLRRIVNVPARGIGDTSLRCVELWGNERGLGAHGGPACGGGRTGTSSTLAPRRASTIGKFVEMLGDWGGVPEGGVLGASRARAAHCRTWASASSGESGLEDMYKKGRTETDEERVDNLAELVSSAGGVRGGIHAGVGPGG